MQKYRHEIILALFAIIVLGPVLYYSIPPYYFTPDVLYVKAKLLAVMEGDFFSDPVTGFPTFHPPYYHMVLAPLTKTGLSMEALILFISLCNVCLTMLFIYLIIQRFYDKTVALITAILLPFVNQYMGPAYLYLATAFYFSIPIFLAGLLNYLSPDRTLKRNLLIGILWGIAYLISPGYLFLIGLLLVYDLMSRKNSKSFVVIMATFFVTLTPFYIQMYTVYATNMAGTSAFSLWRGIPDGEWITSFLLYTVSPSDGKLATWLILLALIIGATGIFVGMRLKSLRPYLIVMAIAYVLTAYHFNYFQYGPRILFFLSLLLTASAVNFITKKISSRQVLTFVLIIIALIFTTEHSYRTIVTLDLHAGQYKKFTEIGQGLRMNLGRYIASGDFVLAGERTYRNFIMPYFPVKSLVAYKTGEYFQVNTKLSEEMKRDLNYFLQDGQKEAVEFITKKYRMSTAVIGGKDTKFAGFHYIRDNWIKVYQDLYFAVYVKPDSTLSP